MNKEIIEQAKNLIAAHSCCQEAKDAANAWLCAVGTADEKEKAKALVAELEEDIMSIWEEHACRTTPESLLAHDADQLDLILNLKRESDLGNRYADKWLESAVERLRTDIAKGLAQTILKTDHTDWWYLGPDRNWWERKS